MTGFCFIKNVIVLALTLFGVELILLLSHCFSYNVCHLRLKQLLGLSIPFAWSRLWRRARFGLTFLLYLRAAVAGVQPSWSVVLVIAAALGENAPIGKLAGLTSSLWVISNPGPSIWMSNLPWSLWVMVVVCAAVLSLLGEKASGTWPFCLPG